MPPWRWPSTSSGLRIVPQSSTHTIRSRRTLPVSVSTSTTARCAPNGQVGDAGLKSSSIASSARRSSPSSEVASCAHETVRVGTPATWKTPRSASSWMSAGLASSSIAASSLPLSATLIAAPLIAAPPACSEREPYVPVPRGIRSVSPWLDRDRVERQAEPVRDEHRERGLVALAGRPEARCARSRRPSAVICDAAPLRLGEAVRDLDVDAQPDAHLARHRRAARRRSCSARSVGVVRALEQQVERAGVVAAVVAARRWPSCRGRRRPG